MTEKFICFDIGGTKIFRGVVEIDFSRRSFNFLDSDKIVNPVDPDKIKNIFIDYSRKSLKNFGTNKVAISSSKVVDFEKQIVENAKPVYGASDFDFKFLKKEKFQVVIENDGKAFSLGSYYFDNNEGKNGLLSLTLGTGIGGGFIDSKGQVLRGANGVALEVSHIKMFFDNKWVKWENISAARGLKSEYLKKTGNKKKAREIFSSINNDQIAKEIIDKAQEYLGQGIASLVNSFNPEKVVFGGGISEEKEYLNGAIQIAERNIFYSKAIPEWEISKLKGKMNVLGVCTLYYV